MVGTPCSKVYMHFRKENNTITTRVKPPLHHYPYSTSHYLPLYSAFLLALVLNFISKYTNA
jgi:hypothetical protein